ncbi:uncharacterized protein LOC129756531 [Uranotaenia lowii]|uniref:uncharacterized protein LOC129756531 n=1 Tax=Uranotaenia lowii TaxID=190385 RepID=UPI002478C69A|nr:uncharacterized protein LOC129756531 [Uranotaenia lowii]
MLFDELDTTDEESDLVKKKKKNKINGKLKLHTKEDFFPEGLYRGPNSGCPLQFYWPVYISGFKFVSPDRSTWYDQVASYFAFFGLPTRMIYFCESDEKLLQFQLRYQVMDMLVYFISEKDYAKAIRICHRGINHGYLMNVTCGRVHDQFDWSRSCLFNEAATDYVTIQDTYLYPLEFLAERIFLKFGKVEFVSRLTATKFAVQFETKEEMYKALRSQMMFVPFDNFSVLCKQRFVESDVLSDIRRLIATDPFFMVMLPKPHIIKFFLLGKTPYVGSAWRQSRYPILSEWAKGQLASRKKPATQENTIAAVQSQMENLLINPKNIKLINDFLRARGAPKTSRQFAKNCVRKILECELTSDT